MIYTNKEFTNEEEKRSDDYLIESTDMAITELVRPKHDLQKAYNYYHGQRDPEQFRYLEENFGLSNPTSLEFTPLVKKHIDAIVGEYIDTPLLPKVSCKDKKTLSNIERDKQTRIYGDVYEFLKKRLNNQIVQIISGQQLADPAIQSEVDSLVEDLENNFVSDYESAAQNVIEYILQSRNTDFQNKLKILLIDLLIAGMAFYRVRPSTGGTNVEIETLNPLQVFTDYNPDAVYRKNDYRSVVVKYMTKSQILSKYGEELDSDQFEKLQSELDLFISDNYTYYIRNNGTTPTGYPASMPGIVSFQDVTPGFPRGGTGYYYYQQNKLIPVYEVEWVTSNKIGKKKYMMDRYETVRIGADIYLLTGKSENVIRSKDNPEQCGLSINGIYFQDRNSNPFSLMLTTAHLQDQYDIVLFFRNNLIASSGTQGDWLDVSQLPTFLGADVTERVQKWIAYKKGGVAIVDTSQEGRAYNANTVYSGFDDTLKSQAIQAFDLTIERIESTCSSITGVFRERLNGINQKDAVTNVAVGVRNSFIITKQYYQQMDCLVTGILTDSLDIAKIVYKKGITGTLILGDKKQKIFTALPEHFTITDYDVHIPSSTDVLKQIEEIKAWAQALIQAGQVGPEILMEVATARSLTELKQNVLRSIKKTKEEQNVLNQLQQQNEQLQQQLKDMSQQLEQQNKKVEQLDERRLEIENKKVDNEDRRKWFEIKDKQEFNRESIRLKEKLLEAEVLQLYDGNKQNDEIKNTI